MDFKGLIDFNKYTVALAAASFVYTLEKFVPMPTAGGRYLVLGVLVIFLASTVLGVVIFAASTAALNGEVGRRQRVSALISRLGTAHFGLLCIGLLVLGGMMYPRVMRVPDPLAGHACSCQRPG